jgi:galactitol-specific phosphotransferase system IIB component
MLEDIIEIYNKYKKPSNETIFFFYFEDDTFLPIISNEIDIEHIQELYRKANITIDVENTHIDYMSVLGSSYELYFSKMKIEDKYTFIHTHLPILIGSKLFFHSNTIEKKTLENMGIIGNKKVESKPEIKKSFSILDESYKPSNDDSEFDKLYTYNDKKKETDFTNRYIPDRSFIKSKEKVDDFKPYNNDSEFDKYTYNDKKKQTIYVLLHCDSYHTVIYVDPSEEELSIIQNIEKYGFITLLQKTENQTNIQKIRKIYENHQFSSINEVRTSMEMVNNLKEDTRKEEIEDNVINVINHFYTVDPESRTKLSDIYDWIKSVNADISLQKLCQYLKQMEISKVRQEDGYYYGLKINPFEDQRRVKK